MVRCTVPFLFQCSVCYIAQNMLMQAGKCNISRSVWRFFEILLFFVISVVGFNFCAKTTNLNAKLKSRSLLQGTGNGSVWFPASHTLFQAPPQIAAPDTHEKFRNGNDHNHVLHIRPQALSSLSVVSPLPSIFTVLPRNLFQQNAILLI